MSPINPTLALHLEGTQQLDMPPPRESGSLRRTISNLELQEAQRARMQAGSAGGAVRFGTLLAFRIHRNQVSWKGI